jgi:hypothetical protein
MRLALRSLIPWPRLSSEIFLSIQRSLRMPVIRHSSEASALYLQWHIIVLFCKEQTLHHSIRSLLPAVVINLFIF